MPAHVLQHLVNRVDLHFAFLIALQGKANGHMLGRLHQQRGLPIVFLRNRGGKGLQKLLKIDLRIRAGFTEFLLQRFWAGIGILSDLPKMREEANGLGDFLFLQWNRSSARASYAFLSCCRTRAAAWSNGSRSQRSS